MARMIPGIGEKLSKIVGDQNIHDDADLLASYQQAGTVAGETPIAVVKPSSPEEVKTLIDLARENNLNLILSSSSPPRFRGDTVPSGDGLIVDMSKMNRIVRMDRLNKVALIEPGITFSDLIEEANKVGLKVLLPLLPRKGKSVIASYLEREPIIIPKYHWDMTDPLFCTELIFGTGEVFRTGSAAGPGTLEQQWEMGCVQKNPMGPGQTDLVRVIQGSQGTMAAVTWASVKLEIKPKIHRFYFVPESSLSKLTDFSYQVLRRKLGDEFFILGPYSLATMLAENRERIDPLASQQAKYTLIYGVSGYEYLPEERVAYQERDLAAIAQNCGVKTVQEVPGCSVARMDDIISSPSTDPYYKMRPKGAFLDIFFLTTLDQVPLFISCMSKVVREYAYPEEELGLYIQPIQHGRACHIEFTLYYDPTDEKDSQKVKNLFDAASRSLDNAGAFFSRPYGTWAQLAYAHCPDTVKVLKKVKSILDPEGVFNRGRLCFTEEVK
jgi:hypothetical protein